MITRAIIVIATALLTAACATEEAAPSETTQDPFAANIPRVNGVVNVAIAEFASVPDSGGGAARMMLLVEEPGTHRLFVSDMRGRLHSLSYDGRVVTRYLDIASKEWNIPLKLGHPEQGFQSFAFHPQFNQPGTPGFGKLYTWSDSSDMTPAADFVPGRGVNSHDTVLLEWTAKTPAALAYDGGPPREMLRARQPFGNHNAGQLGFNPTAGPGDPDFGLLYVSLADGGSNGDPFGVSQSLTTAFGKILRIDPLGSNSANGRYGYPADNPFAADGDDKTLGEIYAYGVRNAQRFAWDPSNRRFFAVDIGQDSVEELNLVTAGANLGWNKWEGSFPYINRSGVGLTNRRGDKAITYPVAEYDHRDPVVGSQAAITGVHIYRGGEIKQLEGLILFGNLPNGEIFCIPADRLPRGGLGAIRRVLLIDRLDGGTPKTLLQIVREKNAKQGRKPAARADLRFAAGPAGQVFILNKHDGTIRRLAPDSHP